MIEIVLNLAEGSVGCFTQRETLVGAAANLCPSLGATPARQARGVHAPLLYRCWYTICTIWCKNGFQMGYVRHSSSCATRFFGVASICTTQIFPRSLLQQQIKCRIPNINSHLRYPATYRDLLGIIKKWRSGYFFFSIFSFSPSKGRVVATGRGSEPVLLLSVKMTAAIAGANEVVEAPSYAHQGLGPRYLYIYSTVHLGQIVIYLQIDHRVPHLPLLEVAQDLSAHYRPNA